MLDRSDFGFYDDRGRFVAERSTIDVYAGERRLELLLAHPDGRDAGRLAGLRGGVQEADRTQDAVAGLDEVIAAEARQLAQAGHESLLDLLDELAGAALIDRLVPAGGFSVFRGRTTPRSWPRCRFSPTSPYRLSLRLLEGLRVAFGACQPQAPGPPRSTPD
jgi:hypothetical protein